MKTNIWSYKTASLQQAWHVSYLNFSRIPCVSIICSVSHPTTLRINEMLIIIQPVSDGIRIWTPDYLSPDVLSTKLSWKVFSPYFSSFLFTNVKLIFTELKKIITTKIFLSLKINNAMVMNLGPETHEQKIELALFLIIQFNIFLIWLYCGL